VSVADDHGEALTAEELDPELLDLLTAHRREPPAEADAEVTAEDDEAATRCHPERPDTPRERSLCVCERACARTIDRGRLARRMLEAGGDRATIQRWLDERRPSVLHYPLVETDGTRIDFDGDGVVTRCRHYSARVPDSAVDVQCHELLRERADAAPAPVDGDASSPRDGAHVPRASDGRIAS
jgi:hypothetical protein